MGRKRGKMGVRGRRGWGGGGGGGEGHEALVGVSITQHDLQCFTSSSLTI